VPLAPEVIVIQDADGDAVQEQPVRVSTLSVPVAAALEIDVLTGESV
jgi:hypothetical protein